MKKALALLTMIAILASFSIMPAYASTKSVDSVMSPQYIQICEVDNGLSVSGKTLSLYAATLGYSDATKCGVTATLQKLSGSQWSTYQTWTATSPSSHPDYVEIDKSISVSSGQYRLVTSHSVTVGTFTEYEGMTSPTRTVS